ncbi:uncharacterized protein LOC129592372 [Paramacrobiotus metropolitanus]|uniref:uncharacterized protein LOC129592372 n=1 Tax=Paramacrobiotus metropolitanus TaxID=2943436 RepID=UPI0024464277|nr:uncharacterized protein LOC129592372 [Paramacrobiotus metropolitanus]
MEALPPKSMAPGPQPVPCSFHDLPDEMVSHIFSFLDIIDITNNSIVCKQWERASRCVTLQKAVILDVQKWDTYAPRPPSADTVIVRRQFSPGVFSPMPDPYSVQRKSLLVRFVSRRTRQLIVRWSLDSLPPAPQMVEQDDEEYIAFRYNFHYDIPQIRSYLREILREYVPEILGKEGVRKVGLTMQNLHLSLNILSGLIPRGVMRVQLESVTLWCHFQAGPLVQRELPVTLSSHIDKDVMEKCGDKWPFDYSESLAESPLFWYPHALVQSFEYFSRFFATMWSPEEEDVVARKLQSSDPVGGTLALYLYRFVGMPLFEDDHPVNAMDLTVDRIRTFPTWLQRLVVELFKRHAD